jgi:hypothetical protein
MVQKLLGKGVKCSHITKQIVNMCTNKESGEKNIAAVQVLSDADVKPENITIGIISVCVDTGIELAECAAVVKALLTGGEYRECITSDIIKACADTATRTEHIAAVQALLDKKVYGVQITEAIVKACANKKTQEQCVAAVKALLTAGNNVSAIEATLQRCGDDMDMLQRVIAKYGTTPPVTQVI